jgi:hypothetical protein
MGASEIDAAFVAILGLEALFLMWLAARTRRDRVGPRMVDDAVRLGLRAARRRA